MRASQAPSGGPCGGGQIVGARVGATGPGVMTGWARVAKVEGASDKWVDSGEI